ncbi:hypothetical protein CERSUDRAFT_98050 [Gelatoporia subvermispora B]|uniref:Uncharacterized protein n=1 Tax=Ceriporiopsis subvermispora (strain B) TaxID=914234 RepID=M2QPM6_CERS8|nr:hypothetical protein CERSUDRAFT_101034 [Gelatoporia subvermispora B]EMD34125.1 hypothetical protein CERSUDRAFT_98050 [Gelatoporia subvermispora B]
MVAAQDIDADDNHAGLTWLMRELGLHSLPRTEVNEAQDDEAHRVAGSRRRRTTAKSSRTTARDINLHLHRQPDSETVCPTCGSQTRCPTCGSAVPIRPSSDAFATPLHTPAPTRPNTPDDSQAAPRQRSRQAATYTHQAGSRSGARGEYTMANVESERPATPTSPPAVPSTPRRRAGPSGRSPMPMPALIPQSPRTQIMHLQGESPAPLLSFHPAPSSGPTLAPLPMPLPSTAKGKAREDLL